MTALNEAGVPTEMIEPEKDFNPDEFQSFQFYGAYPFSCASLLKTLKEGGQKIVYDMDDALTLIDETNPFYYAVRKDLSSVYEILEQADEVTVTTEKMKEYVLSLSPLKKVTVVPNTYTAKDWLFPIPERAGIRIGFAGSSSHLSDLIEIIPVIKNLQDKYNVKFLIMGLGQTDYPTFFKHYRYVSGEKGVKDLHELDKRLSEILFEWVPFVDFEIYPEVLRNLALDIGLCPLINTPFNQCRSAIKAMEYNLAGAIALTSNMVPYTTEPTSILVNEGEWYNEIERVILDEPRARELQESHLHWLKENRAIDIQIPLLKSIYVVMP